MNDNDTDQRDNYSESLLVHFRRIESLKKEALSYPTLDLNRRQLCDLELLLCRGYYPLTGYLNEADYKNVIKEMRLENGTIWPMPICLDVNEDKAKSLEPGQNLALNDEEGFLLAVLKVSDIWKPDKKEEARLVYGTDDPTAHPGVRELFEDYSSWYIGGHIEGVSLPIHYDFKELRRTPSEVHRRFSMGGWRHVLGVHTDSCLHRANKEVIMRAARDVGANIFLQPVVGSENPDSQEHYTNVRCHEEILKKFPRNMITLGLMPLNQKYAGPRAALWHAIIKKNYGCSHFLVTKSHCDPFEKDPERKLFYPVHAAQELVEKYNPETGIHMLPGQDMVYVEDKAQFIPESEATEGMRIRDITPHELRRRLENDLEIPAWFSYPEVIEELKYAFPPRSKQGFTILITGLSGAGKSTIAKVLLVKFLEMRDRPVTLLDGDIVRKNLSSELTFSKVHRNLNIKRIGFVASEITKNGGIALCAPIAPYEESRQSNRALISKYGGYIEVYLQTPLEVCEQRDRKGLYAKARAGIIPAVTGVSDPYTPPSNPEITIDTSDVTPAEGAQEILLYLEEHGYIR